MNTKTGQSFQGSINPHVSVDCVIFCFDEDKLKVLLIEQERPSDADPGAPVRLALPGNLVYENEGLDEAAQRVLAELTKLKGIFLKQFHAFGDPKRVQNESEAEWLKSYRTEPEARVITIAYYSVVKMEDYEPGAGSFARSSAWYDIHEIPSLAFDHNQILTQAWEALKDELNHDRIGFDLLPKKFTLSQLQRVYEVILDRKLDKRNFRKTVKKLENIRPLDEKQTGVNHKPAQLFKFIQPKKK
ncbi:MAG: NUDIX domain-containing protein [Bacteroidota bacterium]|nr:NUDIX domain-containing protein [Bacteroidota bacterium]MDX5429474.1 NUDIX domain-containing protein [Bacteroidota bacterium]MDX5468263.1 NUDIX domain-containing protein [Bacteroidota bacterium]